MATFACSEPLRLNQLGYLYVWNVVEVEYSCILVMCKFLTCELIYIVQMTYNTLLIWTTNSAIIQLVKLELALQHTTRT